jgi:hypothetical protein
MPKLTEAFVGSLGPGRDRIVFDSHPGFAIRIRPSGAKIAAHRFDGVVVDSNKVS